MGKNKIVSREEWVKSRIDLLKKEKEFTKERDRLSQERRSLPWVKVEKDYSFESSDGKVSLSDLFQDQNQLIIYHFMYGPDWEAGCPSCTYLADNFTGSPAHLKQRDVAFSAMSRTSIQNIEAYKKRMGWNFNWVSSLGSDFNYDYGVSFHQEDLDNNKAIYNYAKATYPTTEYPGVSVFCKEDGDIFHTYSTFGRGLDMFITTYHYLDITPKGRDEASLDFPMAWVRRRDEYEA